MPEIQSRRAIATMRTSLADDLLPYHELKEVLSILSGRLDGGLAKKLQVREKREKTPEVRVCVGGAVVVAWRGGGAWRGINKCSLFAVLFSWWRREGGREPTS